MNSYGGKVVEVEELMLGSPIADSYVGGDGSIFVIDARMFEAGMIFQIIDEAGTELGTIESVDYDTGELTLVAALLSSYDFDAFLAVTPSTITRWAHVALTGDDGDPVSARVPQSLFTQLPLGDREASTTLEPETVTIELDSTSTWVVRDVVGASPRISSGVIVDPFGSFTISGDNEDQDANAQLGEGRNSFGQLYIGELESPNVLTQRLDDLTLYVNPDFGDDANNGLDPGVVEDTFTRTVSDGWGLSDAGRTWRRDDAGTASDLNVNGTMGTMLITGSNAPLVALKNWSGLNPEMSFDWGLSALPSAGTIRCRPCVRYLDEKNHYRATVFVDTSGNVSIRLDQILDDVLTIIGAQTGTLFTITASDRLNVKIQAVGRNPTTVRARVWVVGTEEPTSWNLTATDDEDLLQHSGTIAVHSDQTAANANRTTSYDVVTASEITFNPLTNDYDLYGSSVFVGSGPLASVQAAVDLIPKYNLAVCRVLVAHGSNWEEDIEINGFIGPGAFILDGSSMKYTVMNGPFGVSGCAHNMMTRNITLKDSGIDPANFRPESVSASGGGLAATTAAGQFIAMTRYMQFYYVVFHGNNDSRFGAKDGVLMGRASLVIARNCDFRGYDGIRAILMQDLSTIMIFDCTGNATAPDAGVALQTGSKAYFQGTSPAGGLAEGQSSDHSGTYTSATGTAPPATQGKTTKYFKAKSTASWRTTWGWRGDNDFVYQGGWSPGGAHKGLWFYDYAAIVSALAGKTIDSISIYVYRRPEGGTSAGQVLRFWRHNYGSAPAGEPTLVGGTDEGSLAWGAGAWMKLPNSFATALKDGSAKGIALYYPNPSYIYDRYVLINGRDESDSSGKLKITYH